MIEHALKYAAQGLHIFPVHAGTKKAILKGTFDIATTDPEQIRAWWAKYPDANIGWYPHPSGHCVVDLDRGHDEIEMPPTYVQETPSGGEHHIMVGELPSTVGREDRKRKLGLHIDTRGLGGYILLAPSMIDERDEKAAADPTRRGVYKIKHDRPLADVPRAFVEKLAAPVWDGSSRPPACDDIDTPSRIERVHELAAAFPRAINLGKGRQGGSDDATCELANRLLDLCSPEVVVEAMVEEWMPRCQGEWSEDYIREKVERLASSIGTPTRRDAVGCEVYPLLYSNELTERLTAERARRLAAKYDGCGWSMEEIEEAERRAEAKADANRSQRRARFEAQTPEQDAGMPPLTYFDKEKTLPKVPDGAVMVITGPKSSHKTGLVLKKCLDALEAGAHVLYLAAEGAHGIRTIRLPLYRTVREMEWSVLNERWRTLSASFNLFNADDRAALIEAFKEWKPDIIVMDTLTKVIGGEDINTPQTGTALHTHGDEIAAAFGALLILIHHPGKGGSTGSLGSSLIEALAYAVWHVSKEDDVIKCWLEKMKDGPAEFTTNYRVGGQGGVPFVRDENPEERGRAQQVKIDPVRREVIRFLGDGRTENINHEDMWVMLKNKNSLGIAAPGRTNWYNRLKDMADLLVKGADGQPTTPFTFSACPRPSAD